MQYGRVLEKRVDVALPEQNKTVWGRIDILALQQQVWVTVIESKQAGFSLKDAEELDNSISIPE